jgi:hypothetical protein
MLDIKNKDTFWYFDPAASMMLMKYVEFDGKHDSLENAYMAYVAYKRPCFITGIYNCWHQKQHKHPLLMKLLTGNSSYIQGQRYPIPYPGMYGMSRDHLVYSLAALCKANSAPSAYHIGRNVRFMLSPHWGMNMNLTLWLWIRLIGGKKIGKLFYPVLLIKTIKNVIGNNIADVLTGFGGEWEQSKYVNIDIERKKRFPLWRFMISLYYPVYALKLIGTMLDVVDDNWMSKLVKRLCLKITPEYNYVLRLLFDDMTVPPMEEVLTTYKPMTGDRWSTILNPFRNDRWSSILPAHLTQCNVLDVDYMTAVYQERHKPGKA